MKASYKWLKDYCDIKLGPEELAEKLAGLGLKVESTEKVGEDYCYDIETLYSRPDTLCHIGIARDIAAALEVELRLPDVGEPGDGKDVSEWTSVKIPDTDLCPCYTARIISGVKVGPSPQWLKEKLIAVGAAPINNVVDVTNFVMLEMGQPLHAFDYDRLEEGRIVVRRAKGGEKMETIDHVERELDESILAICDAKKPVAIAGVMGGADTEVSGSTKVVLLESAHFEPLSIRRTSRKLGLPTDASYRFERRIDPKGVDASSRRAAELIRQVAGGESAKGVAMVDVRKEEVRELELRESRIEVVLGMKVPMDTAEGILERLGFEPTKRGGEKVRVRVPSWRGDVEGEADLIEEVARVYGYDKVPTELKATMKLGVIPEWLQMERKTRDLLVGMGYFETITVSMVAEDTARAFEQWSEAEPLKVINPVRAGKGALRKSLLGSLLSIKKINQDRGVSEVRLFALGRAYLPRGSEGQADEKKLIGLVEDGDYYKMKGAVEELLEGLGVKEDAVFEEVEAGFLEPGMGARMSVGGEIVGYIGRASSELVSKFELKRAPQMCEIDAEKVWAGVKRRIEVEALPQFPSITRDLALVVPEEVTWEEMRREIDGASSEIVREVKFFDVYRGKNVEAGKKSVAFSVVYRADERTLSRGDAEGAEAGILEALKGKFGAVLRSV